MQNEIHSLFVAEYSPSQKMYHIETIAEMIRNNQRTIQIARPSDYIPFAISPREEDVAKAISSMKKILK